jgi:hypothetical protein
MNVVGPITYEVFRGIYPEYIRCFREKFINERHCHYYLATPRQYLKGVANVSDGAGDDEGRDNDVGSEAALVLDGLDEGESFDSEVKSEEAWFIEIKEDDEICQDGMFRNQRQHHITSGKFVNACTGCVGGDLYCCCDTPISYNPSYVPPASDNITTASPPSLERDVLNEGVEEAMNPEEHLARYYPSRVPYEDFSHRNVKAGDCIQICWEQGDIWLAMVTEVRKGLGVRVAQFL